jgi:uncharacterized protein (TIGR00299 family) protein
MASYHLDCASGIAGDMFLGACLDLGMPLEVVAEAVAGLGLADVSVEARPARRGGFAGTRFRVLLHGRPVEGPDPDEVDDHGHQGHDTHPHAHHHERQQADEHPQGEEQGQQHDRAQEHGDQHRRSGDQAREHAHAHQHSSGGGPGHSHGHQRGLTEIRRLIAASGLGVPVRERALRLFQRLGEAEAKAHGVPIEDIHFHEVGAVDSIVDLVGAAAAVEHLAPERLTCGAVNLGGGRVRTAHGELPVPTPATAELLRGVPVFGGPGGELTTPTGAVLLAELVDAFTDLPSLRLSGTGYGLGRKDLPTHPNVLRLLRGERVAAGAGAGAAGDGLAAAPPAAEVAVVECEIDDLPGEGFGFLMERLLAAGALDVFFTPVQMKKNRPGTLVTLLCRRSQLDALAGILLMESGSLGCRYHMAARFEAERETLEVETGFGRVRIKRARLDGRPLAATPEFEDCRRLALAGGVPWRVVYRAALAAADSAA